MSINGYRSKTGKKPVVFKGFTLIELMVVIAIITVLGCIIVPSILGYVEHANNIADAEHARNIRDMVMVQQALYSDLDCSNPHYDPNREETRDNYKTRGYVYVDKDEIRVSSMQLAKLMEQNGYLKNAEDGNVRKQSANGTEYCYPIDSGSKCRSLLRCRSTKKWDTYQIDFFMDKNGNITFSFSARTGSNGTGGDALATKLFAQMCQGGSESVDMDIGGQS